MTLTLFICYLLPVKLWIDQAAAAHEVNQNFKGSLQMIYNGDKLSKKEAYFHMNAQFSEQSNQMSEENSLEKLNDTSQRKKKLAYLKATDGVIKCEQYPTVMQLRNPLNKMTASEMRTTTVEEFGDVFDRGSPDGKNCVNSKFITMCN